MNIVIAIDSFKGSLTSMEAGECIKKGILRCIEADITICPLADGGEGFVEAITFHQDVKTQYVDVHDSMGQIIKASYAIDEQNRAIMEMASVCGITLVKKELRNPCKASTYGLGELIRDALDKGCQSFLIGVGGSVTNDGGVGMLAALGYRFYDKNHQKISLNPLGLLNLCKIDETYADQRLKDCFFEVACDVENPLLKEQGCSAVFGPQKGADETMVMMLEKALVRYACCVKESRPFSNSEAISSGAGGGLVFGIMSFLNAHVISGAQSVLNAQGVYKHIAKSNLVITGEGCLDEQTTMGKGPAVVAQMAKLYNKAVIAFAGMVKEEAREALNTCFDAYLSIQNKPCILEEALHKEIAMKNLMLTAEQCMRMYLLK